MKGQAQSVTAIMITAVIVGSIASAYLWGIPYLEKRKSELKVQSYQNDALNLYDQIKNVANAGKGASREIKIGNQGQGELNIEVNPANDYIDITTSTKSSPYKIDSWTVIRGKTSQALSISSGNKKYVEKSLYPMGAVAVKPVGSPGSTTLNYRIEFRNVYLKTPTGAKLEKIDLKAPDRRKASGQTTIVIANEGLEQDTGSNRIKIDTGEKLPRERTIVSIRMR